MDSHGGICNTISQIEKHIGSSYISLPSIYFGQSDAWIQPGVANKDKGSFKGDDVEFGEQHCSVSSESQEGLTTLEKKDGFDITKQSTTMKILLNREYNFGNSDGCTYVISENGKKIKKIKIAMKEEDGINSDRSKDLELIIVDTVIQECDYDKTMKEIMKTADEVEGILKYHDCIIREFEISRCDLQKEHFEVLLQKIRTLVKAANKKLTIQKLSIETTKNVKETILACCEIVRLCSTTSISFQFNNLKSEDIKLLCDNLHKNVELKELNISYNKNISSEGFSHVGSIVQQHGVKSLIATDCNISDVELQSLIYGMKDAKLYFLDISSSKLLPAGFEYLGEFVAGKKVKRLKLSGFQLTKKNLEAYFAKTTNSIQESDSDPTLLEELDVSYNSTMAPKSYATLGIVVRTCGVKELNLAGCSLGKKHLRNLNNRIRKHQLTALNTRDNSSIGEGIVEIAKIVKSGSLEELDISECQFDAQELKIFREALGGAKLKCLILGDSKRKHDEEYISEVSKLLPYVIKRLQLISGSCNEVCRSMLLEELNSLTESDLKVKLNDDITLSRSKGILVDEKVSSAAELRIILQCSSGITPVAYIFRN